jgi:hypothetical protein
VSERSKWNVAAIMAGVLLLLYVGVYTWAVIVGRVQFNEWAAGVGPLVGVVMGWVGKMLTGPNA